MRRVPFVLAASCFGLGASVPLRAQCPGWEAGFAGAGVLRTPVHVTAFGGEILAFGPDIRVPTTFRFARFDGAAWRNAPVAPNARVRDSAFFNDGAGPQLYLVGEFLNPGHHVTRWDGTTFGTVPGLVGTSAYGAALVVHDDGSGPALYAGGNFTTPGNYIARFRSGAWSALGSGVNGVVYTLAVHDEGAGPRLFAGGTFSLAGGAFASNVARWNGSAWSAVGAGVPSSVTALASYDSGTGARLYASQAPGAVLAWDGASWSQLPNQVTGPIGSLEVHDDGAGPRLYASDAYGVTRSAARYDGANWTELPGPVRYVESLASVGGSLVLGGAALNAISAASILAWNGTGYRSLGAGLGFDAPVFAFEVRDHGAGPVVYASGSMWSAGGTLFRGVARWDGDGWSTLGNGLMGNTVQDLEFFDDGSGAGPRLHAAGGILSTGTRVAVWDGSTWLPVAGSILGGVDRLRVFDDGTGPQLYAAGFFSGAGENIARFDGVAWTAAGSGTNSSVLDLEVFDEGAGPRLFAAGQFNQAGGTFAQAIARFDGTTWSAVGSSLPFTTRDLELHDDGGGVALYAASDDTVLRWDGSTWTSLGTPRDNQNITRLVSHDEGAGPQLLAAAGNIYANGTGDQRLYRWTGSSWVELADSSFNGLVRALASTGSPAAPRLFVGGDFTRAGPVSSSYVAVRATAGMTPACFGDGLGTPCPCGNDSATAARAGCANSSGSGATLRGRGCASVTSDAVVLEARGLLGGAALFFQGTVAVNFGMGAAFGDGLRCAGGNVVRLGTVLPAAGAADYPNASQPTPVSVRGGIASGGVTRWYQAWYRNNAAFCTPDGWNLTNALRIEWGA